MADDELPPTDIDDADGADPTRTAYGVIEPIEIEEEMERSFLDYSMSVIVSRALPDVRDGLKPVHRRILWGMYDVGADERITLHRKRLSCRFRGPVPAAFRPLLAGTGPLRRSPVDADHADLPAFSILIGCHETIERLFWRDAFGEQIEQLRPVLDARAALRGNGAHTGTHPWHGVPHAWIACSNGDASFLRDRIDDVADQHGESPQQEQIRCRGSRSSDRARDHGWHSPSGRRGAGGGK